MDEFGSFSGLKLNKNKTGKNENKNKNHQGIKWGHGPIKSLGIYFGTDLKVTNNLMSEGKITTIDKLTKDWKKRKLTLIGKSVVIKSLVIHIITCFATIQEISKSQIKQLNTLIYSFLWDHKPDKVKRSIIIKKVEPGGVNIRDIEAHIDVLNINWVKRLCNGVDGNWKVIPRLCFNTFGKDFLLFKMNIQNI